jgi:hypothetical protein
MTGRGAGWCAGYEGPGFGAPAFGRGLGLGYRGGGRGWRNMYYATPWRGPAAGLPRWARPGFVPPAAEAELALGELKAQADWLAGRLADIQKHIEDIEGHGSAPAEP